MSEEEIEEVVDEGIKKNEDGTVTITLDYPVKWTNHEEVSTVDFRRIRGGDMLNMGSDPTLKDMLQIAAKISEYPPTFFHKMDAVDTARVQGIIGDFLDRGQKTGKTS